MQNREAGKDSEENEVAEDAGLELGCLTLISLGRKHLRLKVRLQKTHWPKLVLADEDLRRLELKPELSSLR